MRKRIINNPAKASQKVAAAQNWLNLEDLVEVEVTSEEKQRPVESALLPGSATGWRAADPGEQVIRLVFNSPQAVKTIMLRFFEPGITRTQQYVLRWSDAAGQSREIVRQQWNFSPEGAPDENEIHHVNLAAVKMLELSIVPDISGGDALANLEEFRIA